MAKTQAVAQMTPATRSATPAQDAADQVLEQMFGYYTRERPTPRVVTELDSREAA